MSCLLLHENPRALHVDVYIEGTPQAGPQNPRREVSEGVHCFCEDAFEDGMPSWADRRAGNTTAAPVAVILRAILWRVPTPGRSKLSLPLRRPGRR
jgi:hypothetical protein